MKPQILAFFLLVFAILPIHAGAPTLKAAEAAAIAQGDLENRQLTDVHIVEMRFKEASLLGGEPDHWEVMWSKEIPAQTEGRKEIGLKVKMDGTYSRSVR
jgi:hypothetical protein